MREAIIVAWKASCKPCCCKETSVGGCQFPFSQTDAKLAVTAETDRKVMPNEVTNRSAGDDGADKESADEGDETPY
jgi:hypothetical protein